ncbi:hypothetical protein SAMN05216548_110128 [Faunimonas pinastri]|uniref:NAD(FAD)-utilizing dehydrogenase n=1 Tax=Faunimonas pinastri TaxID=1855383 RepID=A0A1H9KY65_9HYPH|nr:TIGR03862 family flavoprotein [Faunimonas pinastri]SER04096.1 hypothetical protein SAMN05216548_110128 [Faunimonas pinastri]
MIETATRATDAEIVVIGAGPAGLAAAEVLSAAGARVTVHDRMPTAGRKLLMAGRGGLNLTHSEPLDRFLGRYGAARERLDPTIHRFSPDALRAWAEALGQETFVGTSGRVFPRALKASPLLRAWLSRLSAAGVSFRFRSEWQGWDDTGALRFAGTDGPVETVRPAAALLALGGASWPKLGSNAAWVPDLGERGVEVTPFRSANCGFDIVWSEIFRDRFAGEPLKGIAASFGGQAARGEAVVTAYGIEGGVVYALSSALRDAVEANGEAVLHIDLRPDMPADALAERLARTPESQSLANRLRKALRLSPLAANLLRETAGAALPRDPASLAALIKAVPLRLVGVQPLARAISSAGGVRWSEVDADFMLRKVPGTFVAGEMLDWEAPTGGYLLQASFASGVAAAEGTLRWLGEERSKRSD